MRYGVAYVHDQLRHQLGGADDAPVLVITGDLGG